MKKRTLLIYFLAVISVHLIFPTLIHEKIIITQLFAKLIIFVTMYYCYSVVESISAHPSLNIKSKAKTPKAIFWRTVLYSFIFTIFCVLIIFNLIITIIFLTLLLNFSISTRQYFQNLAKNLMLVVFDLTLVLKIFFVSRKILFNFYKDKVQKQTSVVIENIKPQHSDKIQLEVMINGDNLNSNIF